MNDTGFVGARNVSCLPTTFLTPTRNPTFCIWDGVVSGHIIV